MLSYQEKASNYAIYIRKSTDEKGKQEKSIEDQLHYCLELARAHELPYKEENVVQEKLSAKLSGARPQFNRLLEDIRNGKIDGIIAWHPDRLARNMGDGGQVIELVDDGRITDLRFCTQQFSKDANGKMLLGLAFVLSKQYSDKLSDDVKRGQYKRHETGKAMGRSKHGYGTNSNDEYIKGEFWDLLHTAWTMRLNGDNENSISDWLNKNGYYKKLKDPKKMKNKQIMTPQKLNDIFKDKFYCGYMTMNDREVYLNDLYDFPQIISEEQYWTIQRLGRGGGPYIKRDKPLRGKIFDLDIEGLEYKPQIISNKQKKKYLIYIVDRTHKNKLNKDDQKKIKSVRALKIVEALDKLFQNINPNFSDGDYERYVKAAKKHCQSQSIDRSKETSRIRGMRTKTNNILIDIEENYLINGKSYDGSEKSRYKNKKADLEKEIKEYTKKIAELEKEEMNIIPTFKKVLNTLKTLASSYNSMSGDRKLEIAEIIILNTIIKDGEVHRINLLPPFDELLISNGWGRGIRTPECQYQKLVPYHLAIPQLFN